MKLILTIWKADSITLTSCLKFHRNYHSALPQAYWLNNVVEGKSPRPRKNVEIPNKKRYSLRMKKLVNDLSIYQISICCPAYL